MNEQPTVWRSLDELAATPEFRDFAEGEFPQISITDPEPSFDRRRFLQILGASLALGGVAGCRRPVMEILPYGRKPEEVVPGLPTFYATAIPRPGGCFPVLVESHEGRPTKIEGHPKHPHSHGKTDSFAQAAILDLYDPDRSRGTLRKGVASTLVEFDQYAGKMDWQSEGVRFLSGDDTSPALRLLREQFPKAGWHVHEPLGQENILEGAKIAFGKPMVPEYWLDQADVILCLDADPLGLDPRTVSNISSFSSRRVPDAGADGRGMNRLYVVENQLTTTGCMADHRLALPGSQILRYAFALADHFRGLLPSTLHEAMGRIPPLEGVSGIWVNEVGRDLRGTDPEKTKGRGLIVAGPRQPPVVHAIVAILNQILGATGKSVFWREPVGQPARSIKELADDIDRGAVKTLVILGGNPVREAPADLDLANRLAKIENTIHLGLYADETAKNCTWHVPQSHFLESWGDVEAFDGTYSAVQPLIAPLHVDSQMQQPLTRSSLELLSRWADKFRASSAYSLVLESFRRRTEGKGDEKAFRKLLHEGFLSGSVRRPTDVKLNETGIADSIKAETARKKETGGYELSFHGDYRIYDGRFANNAWLREMPDPVSKLTWDNAVLVSPETAKELKVTTGDLLKITAGGRAIEIPVFVQPGQADKSLSVHLGFGHLLRRLTPEREQDRPHAEAKFGAGFNVYPLRTSQSLWFVPGVEVAATGRKYVLASTQDHGNVTQYSRDHDVARRVDEIVRVRTLEQFHEHKEHPSHHPLPLITHPLMTGQYQWGMVIDLTRCVGCNACQVACQAENNVPIVGKDEILRGREMFWIRIDRYYRGDEKNPEVVHLPLACVHCENAPCETVCPVNASVHSPEGLNVQVYNRCVGTRYCANNCPYKVRRFNWFDYNQRPLDKMRLGPIASPKGVPETLKMQKNPDVTVRMRGVMEKCTYCVQRVERAKINAKIKHANEAVHPIADGTVVPACEQACPAGAIVFGDLKDSKSRVSRLKKDRRNYTLLESVGTMPRTTYLLRLRNPNPKFTA